MKINENLTMAERMKAAVVAKIIQRGLVQQNDASKIKLSDIPYFVEWATGFGGVWLVGETEEGQEFFYTPDQWDTLDDGVREIHLKRAAGILLRAKGKEFVIALQDCPDMYAWCPPIEGEEDTPVQVDITNRSGSMWAAIDFEGPNNTSILVAAESPAAIAAVNYKTTGIHGAALADWYLPTYGEWLLIFTYRNKINSALKSFFGTNNYIAQAAFWTSTPSGSTTAWGLSNPSTTSYTTSATNYPRTNQMKVRSCSQYKCTKKFMIYGKN